MNRHTLFAALLVVACQARPAADASRRPVVRLPEPGHDPAPRSAVAARAAHEVACRVREEAIYDTVVPVRLQPDAPPMLWVRAPRAVLSIETSAQPLAEIELAVGGVAFETRWAPADLPLRPARAVVFAQHVIPASRATFVLVSAEPGRVTVSYQLSREFVPRDVLETQVPCDALALAEQSFEPIDALALGKASGEKSMRAGTPVPFYAEAFGPEVGRHTLSLDNDVSVFSVEGDRSLIALDTTDELLFGWVPSRMLDGTLGSVGLGNLYTSGRDFGTGPSDVRWTNCNHELELFVRRGSESNRIGKMAPGTSFLPHDAGGEETPVRIDSDSIRLAPDVVLSVRSRDLETCSPVE